MRRDPDEVAVRAEREVQDAVSPTGGFDGSCPHSASIPSTLDDRRLAEAPALICQ